MDAEDDMKALSPDTVAALVNLRDALMAAPSGKAGGMVKAAAADHGVSVQTIYRWLTDHAGYKPDRKLRSDAGKTKVSTDVLDFVASARREAMRGNGKEILPTAVALNIAAANGMDINASADTINRQLRQRRMQPRQMAVQRATVSMQSQHPNHVHQIDPSLCVLYYMGGKQRMMTEQQFNKNKPGNYVKVKMKVWRYVRYDHASARIDVRYYEAAGENQRTMFDFLMYTWGQQPGRLCYGLPRMLYWDKGSANSATGVVRMLDALGVQHETHAPGHAWSKGGVENANNLVETHFESRLRFEPVETVEQLNAAAQNWARDYNANTLAHVDSRLVRASGEPLVRDDLWAQIALYPGALVACPPREVCAWFLTGREETRQVTNHTISFVHPELGRSHSYDLSAWASQLGNKVKLRVMPLLLQGGRVRLELERFGQEPLVFEADPVTEFNAFGQRTDGPTFGQDYARAPKSADELQADRLAAVAWGKGVSAEDAEGLRENNKRPFADANDGKGLVAHSHLGQGEQLTRLLPKALDADTPALAKQAARIQVMLTVPEAVRAIRDRLGDGAPADLYSQIKAAFPAGHVPQEWADHWGSEAAATGTEGGASAPTALRRVK